MRNNTGISALSAAVTAILLGLPHTARATYLTQDGDFNAQTIGTTVGLPYMYVSGGGDTVTAGAQSPFTNAFANNGKGVNTPAGGSYSNPYFVSSNSTSAETGGMLGAPTLYFNTDFENVANDGDALGGYDFEVTNSASHAQRSVAIYITQGAVYAESSAGIGTSLLTPTVGVWYNLQLTLNVVSQTYSGTIFGSDSSVTPISSRSFAQSGQMIGDIYTDTGSSTAVGLTGTFPTHNIDNFVLSNSPVPEPATITLLSGAALGCLVRRRRA